MVFGSYEIVENKLTKLLERVAKITEEISIEKLEKENNNHNLVKEKTQLELKNVIEYDLDIEQLQ